MEEKFEYFMERTEKDLAAIQLQLERLINFRLMLLGASAALATLFSVATTLLVMYLDRH